MSAYVFRKVGRISNLGGGDTTLQGHFFIKLKGQFLKIKRALLCLFQNLGGGAHVPSSYGPVCFCIALAGEHSIFTSTLST